MQIFLTSHNFRKYLQIIPLLFSPAPVHTEHMGAVMSYAVKFNYISIISAELFFSGKCNMSIMFIISLDGTSKAQFLTTEFCWSGVKFCWLLWVISFSKSRKISHPSLFKSALAGSRLNVPLRWSLKYLKPWGARPQFDSPLDYGEY